MCPGSLGMDRYRHAREVEGRSQTQVDGFTVADSTPLIAQELH